MDSVLEHEGNLKQKKSLLFKVRWLGYDASHADKLYSYLKEIGRPNEIPGRFS